LCRISRLGRTQMNRAVPDVVRRKEPVLDLALDAEIPLMNIHRLVVVQVEPHVSTLRRELRFRTRVYQRWGVTNESWDRIDSGIVGPRARQVYIRLSNVVSVGRTERHLVWKELVETISKYAVCCANGHLAAAGGIPRKADSRKELPPAIAVVLPATGVFRV